MIESSSNATLHPLLRGLKPAWLAAIGECSVQSSYKPGDYLFRAGDTATRLYLVQSGHVGIELGMENSRTSQVAVMGPGDLIACPCSGRTGTWRFSAPAFDHVSCQSILVKRLRNLCNTDRELACEISQRIICALV
ncbi:MAG: cyclic nucleotide-binding domain-containing protein, partial [Deltaproteobacteria bacterium]